MCGMNMGLADYRRAIGLAERWAEKCGAMTARKDALLGHCEALLKELREARALCILKANTHIQAAIAIERERARMRGGK